MESIGLSRLESTSAARQEVARIVLTEFSARGHQTTRWLDQVLSDERLSRLIGYTSKQIQDRFELDPNISSVADLLGQDQLLVERIISLSNSALYPHFEPITTLPAALMMIGFEEVLHLLRVDGLARILKPGDRTGYLIRREAFVAIAASVIANDLTLASNGLLAPLFPRSRINPVQIRNLTLVANNGRVILLYLERERIAQKTKKAFQSSIAPLVAGIKERSSKKVDQLKQAEQRARRLKNVAERNRQLVKVQGAIRTVEESSEAEIRTLASQTRPHEYEQFLRFALNELADEESCVDYFGIAPRWFGLLVGTVVGLPTEFLFSTAFSSHEDSESAAHEAEQKIRQLIIERIGGDPEEYARTAVSASELACMTGYANAATALGRDLLNQLASVDLEFFDALLFGNLGETAFREYLASFVAQLERANDTVLDGAKRLTEALARRQKLVVPGGDSDVLLNRLEEVLEQSSSQISLGQKTVERVMHAAYNVMRSIGEQE